MLPLFYISIMFDTEKQYIDVKIGEFFEDHDLPQIESLQWAPIPFSGEWGISTSFFQTAAAEARAGKKVNVPVRAQEIGRAIADYLGTPPGFSRVEAVRGYLNLFFSSDEFSQRVVDTVLKESDDFGRGASKNKRVMVEFSQPNTHKAFHVGHLRNVMVGATICNILEAAGYEVIRANYIGDIGLHVIKWLWNYLEHHKGEKPLEDVTRWMGDIYAEADRRLNENPELEREVRALFSLWDQRDPGIVALWEKTRQWSLDGFEQIYKMLGVRFDRIYFESEVEESGKILVEKMIEQAIAEDERPEGPVIVRLDDLLGLEKETYRVLVVLRSDNTSLYATKDLPLAIKKFEEFDLDRSIYVIDVRQSLYLQQIFKTLEMLGYEWAQDCYHLAYEIVNLPGNVTMKSREGTVVLLEDLMRESVQRAAEIVEEKNPAIPPIQKREVAEAVGLGAIKYPLVARDNTKIATFDWESALDFEGKAAPYLQYAHVRANSILRKMDGPLPKSLKPDYELDPTEIQLIDLVSRVPSEVQRAAEEYKTLHITNLAYELARAFNDFYHQCPVLSAKPAIRDARLRLVAASKQSLANLLGLLGITAPDVM